jgi:hypothetical protein
LHIIVDKPKQRRPIAPLNRAGQLAPETLERRIAATLVDRRQTIGRGPGQ